MSAQLAAQPSGYIQAQMTRLQSELAQVRTRSQGAVAKVREGNERMLSSAASAIAADSARSCDAAAAAALERARRGAWPAALTLSAPWGPGRPQALCWMGVLVAVPVVAMLLGMGGLLMLIAVAGAYAWLVHWGRRREAERASASERAAIEGFRALRPQLLAFDVKSSADPDYPYSATMAPVGNGESFSQDIRTDTKTYGPQFGATFLGLRDGARNLLILVRLPVDGFSLQAIPFNDLQRADPRWAVWSGLAEGLAAGAVQHATAIKRFAEEVGDWQAELSRARLIEQRIETLSGQEQAWSDVALPAETLDAILSLVDSFKSGRPVKGILLHGPPGTGKTLIARKLAQHAGCNFVSVGIADLKAPHIGETGPRVREVWERCRKGAPTILFIDECESVFAARGSNTTDAFGNELVQTFLAEWDGFNQCAGEVFVIGATNRHELLDNAVMSRFTESIEIPAPDAHGRERILANEIAKARLHFAPTEDMVRETAGMSGRDIHTLVSKIVASHLHGEVTREDFAAEVRKLRGKQSTSVERLGWDALVLPESTLAEFRSLGRELVHAEELRKLGVGVPRGILLYGPPGTGKTQVARVLASESGLAFIAASSSELKAGYTGQSGGLVRQLFEKARAQAPCILFLDELDTVARSRGDGDSFTGEIVAQLLQELDGVATKKGQVFLLAASNHPGSIDSALLSRFERRIEIGLPDEPARAAILALQLAGKPLSFEVEAACVELARRTGGFSGRDLQSLVTTATRRALQRAIQETGDPRTFTLVIDDLETSLAA
ncbi:AAA family ATPase [Luteimonas sp. MC1895]|uniref:AAA family ATPase n=1 Tax=Luteimonas sp. MC1895 TaxID=2819513 RepID=UPI0031BB3BB2